MKLDPQVLVRRLTMARMAMGLTRAEAEEALGLRALALKRIEDGAQKIPASLLFAAAEHYRVSVVWLVGATEVGGPDSTRRYSDADMKTLRSLWVLLPQRSHENFAHGPFGRGWLPPPPERQKSLLGQSSTEQSSVNR